MEVEGSDKQKVEVKEENPSKETTEAQVKTEPVTEDLKSDKKPYYIGAHVSSAGGAFNAVENASKLGATAFALFLKSQRQWSMPAIKSEAVEKFKENMKTFGFTPEQVLPHGSYLCNIGTIDDELFAKAQNAMCEECKRVELLGLKYLNIHPGSTSKKCTKEESIAQIAKAINYIHSQTSYMTIVLENTAGGGGTVGVDFKELKSIIDLVENKDRIGVCIDTCHAFASGMNIAASKGIEKMVAQFDEVIGLHYLKAMHLNDSMGGLGSNRDRHKKIGEGEIGLDTFRQIMNCDALRGIPLVLETPQGNESEYDLDHGWAKEIALLNSLVGVEKVEGKKKGISALFSKGKGKKKAKEEKEEEEMEEEEEEEEETEKKQTKKKQTAAKKGTKKETAEKKETAKKTTAKKAAPKKTTAKKITARKTAAKKNDSE